MSDNVIAALIGALSGSVLTGLVSVMVAQSQVRSANKNAGKVEASNVTLNPDLIFGGVAVGDVKYKMWERDWNRVDLYQAITFVSGSVDQAPC
jgi:hypothetical protein